MPRINVEMREFLNKLGWQILDEHDVNMRARVISVGGFVTHEPFELPAIGDEVILTAQATLLHANGAVMIMASTDDPGTWGGIGDGYLLLESH